VLHRQILFAANLNYAELMPQLGIALLIGPASRAEHLIFGLPLGSRHPPTLAIGREKCLRKKAVELRFLSFNRRQALAKLTWWLIDSNVKYDGIKRTLFHEKIATGSSCDGRFGIWG
jgi:hypothetical protein